MVGDSVDLFCLFYGNFEVICFYFPRLRSAEKEENKSSLTNDSVNDVRLRSAEKEENKREDTFPN